MENNFTWNEPQVALPNATVVLVLGIVSIITCCCYGIVGVICAIIALVLAKSATSLYISEPGKYTESSYKNVNAGKICAWIGLSFSALYILFMVWLVVTLGFAAFTDPAAIYEYFGVQPPY